MGIDDNLSTLLHPYNHRGMEHMVVKGGAVLHGVIQSPRAKNAALPILAASLLAQKAHIYNVPALGDIATMCGLLDSLQCNISYKHHSDNSIEIICEHNDMVHNNVVAPYDLVRKMRASILVMGPLLARHGYAIISLPGGCAIGARPVDLHLQAFEQMGVTITIENGYIYAKASNGLKGAVIDLSFPSVGATENIMMAASMASGQTIIKGAACEPEIANLGEFLENMGVVIEGLGTSILTITPVGQVPSCATISVMEDRIQAGSFILASMVTGGELTLKNAKNIPLDSFYKALEQSGVFINKDQDDYIFKAPNIIQPITLVTAPYPGYPTDLQAQMAAYLCYGDGISTIHEHVFENRFMHIPELTRMGADITVQDSKAMIKGNQSMTGADVMATDLRASMGLVIAALSANGISKIHRLYHLDRGYENLDGLLRQLGADITRAL